MVSSNEHSDVRQDVDISSFGKMQTELSRFNIERLATAGQKDSLQVVLRAG